ncbi:hypothetical protein J6590_074961 [Homalodisca vitripennis]|nr:hypothetical protein J6590_074961 [Homalodisca vitripennis]
MKENTSWIERLIPVITIDHGGCRKFSSSLYIFSEIDPLRDLQTGKVMEWTQFDIQIESVPKTIIDITGTWQFYYPYVYFDTS